MRLLWSLALILITTTIYAQVEVKTNPHKPLIENQLTIFSYLKLYNIDTTNVFYLKDTTSLVFGKSCTNGAVIFNKKGEMVRYTNERFSCTDPTKFLSKMASGDIRYPVDTSFTLAQVMEMIKPYGTYRAVDNPDYTVVIFWIKFTGYYNCLEKIKGWMQTIEGNNHAKINVSIAGCT